MADQAVPDAIQKIRVVNRNDFTIRDRYDGVPYVFEPGKAVDLPPEVAEHILGYPGEAEDMWRHMSKRWGWNLPHHFQISPESKGLTLSQLYCKNVVVSVERFELRRVTDPRAPIPADAGDDDITVHEPPAAPRHKETPEQLHDRMARVRAARKNTRAARLGVQPEKATEGV